MIENLYKLEKSIFHEFALETSNNIHVKAVDLNNPLSSVCKIFLSDIISSQLHSRPSELPIIIPTRIFIEDIDSSKYCYLYIEQAGKEFIEQLFRERDEVANSLTEASTDNERTLEAHKKQIIEKLRNAVLRNQDAFYSKCINWPGADIPIAGCADYNRIANDFSNEPEIVFDNSKGDEVKAYEKVNYVIKVSHVLSNSSTLTKENVDEFLAKLSVLALHTKRNRKTFAEITSFAIKAAISQVMARNMSHNIGSHVLTRLTDGAALASLDLSTFRSYLSKANTLDSKAMAPFHQLAIYNAYVKCRMDYLSDITFGTPVMHTNKRALSELYKGLDNVRLLLEFISGLSDFEYTLGFALNGEPLRESSDIAIAMPNDLLGCQAFYNIIENLIRNTAKHNQGKQGITEFTVNFIDVITDENGDTLGEALTEAQTMFYAVEVYDNVPIDGYREFTSDEDSLLRQEYINDLSDCSGAALTESMPISNIDWLVYWQNRKINQSVLQEDNRLRSSSLGLLEMEASAAYLRKLDVIHIEDEDYKVEFNDRTINSRNRLNILKAFNKDNQLAYRFFVSKPTEVLLVGHFGLDQNRKDALARSGIWLRTEQEFAGELRKGEVYNHQFVLYLRSESIQSLLKQFSTSLPLRLVEIPEGCVSGLNSPSSSSSNSSSSIEEWAWQQWFSQIKSDWEQVNVFSSFQPSNPNHTNPKAYNIALSKHNEDWFENEPHYPSDGVNYLEALSSNAQRILPRFTGELDDYIFSLDEMSKRKLFEAAITNVLTIDERIQRMTETQYLNIPCREIFERTNVVIPDEMKLDAPNYTSTFSSSLLEYIDDNIGNCRFLLIHYSILERMFSGLRPRINNQLTEWAKITRVVVTSGRAKPPDLPTQHVCFLNLSPVLNVFTEARSKYAINYLLHAARK